MFTTIDDLLHSNNQAVINTATIAQELKKNLANGSINQEEYEDLADDLLNLDRIDKLASNIQDKADLKKAFDFLKIFLGLLGK